MTYTAYQDDPSLPAESRIYFSVASGYFIIFFALIILAVSVLLICARGIYSLAAVGAIALYMIYRGVKRIRDKSPQLIVSGKGIESAKCGFVAWKDIANENVIVRKRQFQQDSWVKLLQYDGRSGLVELDITELRIGKDALIHMLQVYRWRYERESYNQD